MSLLRDLVMTAGDALRLSSDLMRYKFEVEARAVKRSIGQVMASVAVYFAALLLVGTGVGFILYGFFILVARETGLAAAGFIIGVAVWVVAGILILIGRSMAHRR